MKDVPLRLAPVLLLLFCVVSPGDLVGEESKGPPELVLRSGRVLRGKIVKVRTFGRQRMAEVQTDFGTIQVPRSEIGKVVKGKKYKPDSTFHAHRIVICQIEGDVTVRRADDAKWRALSKHPVTDRYGNVNRGPAPPKPGAIRPGDSIRTGAKSSIDLAFHTDAWVRVLPDSELLISRSESDASLKIERGTTLHSLSGAPRGQTFRLRTPSSLLAVRKGYGEVASTAKGDRVRVVTGRVEDVERGEVIESGKRADISSSGVRLRKLDPRWLSNSVVPPPRPPPDDMVYVPATRTVLAGDAKPKRKRKPKSKSKSKKPKPAAEDWEKKKARMRREMGYSLIRKDREVAVGAFLIDRREVTSDEFLRSGIATSAFWDGHVQVGDTAMYDVSIEAAQAYAKWVGKVLPTETQWELAARGPKSADHPYPWGDDPKVKKKITWGSYSANRWAPPSELPSVNAKTKDVSPYGVKFMVSGVVEYCRNRYLVPIMRRDGTYELLDESKPPPWSYVYRGLFGSTRMQAWVLPSRALAAGKGANHRPGFRCVIELGPPPPKKNDR